MPWDCPPADTVFTRAQEAAGSVPSRRQGQRDLAPRLERIGERTEDFVDTVESAVGRAVPKKMRGRRDPRQNTIVNVIWRAMVLVVGLCLICLGVVLLVLPGPGWGAILLGLAVLATEYTWANRLLAPVRRRVTSGAAKVRTYSRPRQLAVAGACCVIAAAGLAASYWYATTQGWI